MIEIVLVLSLVISIVLFFVKSRFAEHDAAARLFAAGFLEFTVPITIASAIFAALGRWLAVTASTTAETTIAEIEWALRWIRNKWIDPLHLSAGWQFVLVLLLVSAGMIWPQIRKHELLDTFNRTTKWIGRLYMTATLCVSFTFLGSVYAGRARVAELRLSRDIKTIERHYNEYLNVLGEVVETELAAQLVHHPVWEPAVADLRGAAERFTVVQAETRAARERVAQYPKIEYRDFPLPLEVDPSGRRQILATRSVRENRSASQIAARRDSWNLRKGQARQAEAEQLRNATVAKRTQSSEVLEKGFDLTQERLGEMIAAAVVRDATLAELLKLSLDPSVLYTFRDMAAKELDAAFRESLVGATPLRDIIARRVAGLRLQLDALATRAASSFAESAASCAATWRQAALRAQELRGTIDTLLMKRAEAQYVRESEGFARDWRTHNRFPTDKLTVEAGRLLDRILRRTSQRPPLDGVAELRALRPAAIRGGETAGAAAEGLAGVEVNLFGAADTPLFDFLDHAIERMVEENRRTPWGSLRARAEQGQLPVTAPTKAEADLLAAGMAQWRREERRRASELVAAGHHWDAQAWEQSFAAFCESNDQAAAAWGLAMRVFYSETTAEDGYVRYARATGRDSARAERVFSREGVRKLVKDGSGSGRTTSPGVGKSGTGSGHGKGSSGGSKKASGPKPPQRIVHR